MDFWMKHIKTISIFKFDSIFSKCEQNRMLCSLFLHVNKTHCWWIYSLSQPLRQRISFFFIIISFIFIWVKYMNRYVYAKYIGSTSQMALNVHFFQIFTILCVKMSLRPGKAMPSEQSNESHALFTFWIRTCVRLYLNCWSGRAFGCKRWIVIKVERNHPVEKSL